jgi:hypothetical protein
MNDGSYVCDASADEADINGSQTGMCEEQAGTERNLGLGDVTDFPYENTTTYDEDDFTGSVLSAVQEESCAEDVDDYHLNSTSEDRPCDVSRDIEPSDEDAGNLYTNSGECCYTLDASDDERRWATVNHFQMKCRWAQILSFKY